MYGVSKETVSADDIGKYRLNEQTRAKHIQDILEFTGVEEVALMSSGFRNEYYLHVNETIFKHGDLLRYLSDFTEKPLKEVILETYSKFNKDVIRHLFAVASGIDATPKGTICSLRSAEDALTLSKEENTIGLVLKELFERAIEYAREVRVLPQFAPLNQTEVSRSIRILQNKLSGLANKNFTLFGNSYEVLHLAKTLLCAEASSVTVANTNYEESLSILNELKKWNKYRNGNDLHKIHAADIQHLPYRLAAADGIILSSTEQYNCLTEELFSEVSIMRQTKKIQIFVDLDDSQENFMLVSQPEVQYYTVCSTNKKITTDEQQQEEAMMNFDESLLHATDRFMDSYQELMSHNEVASIFKKPTSGVGN